MKISVVIQGKQNEKFKGFYIQARDQDGHPIGTFLIPDEKEAGVHDCFASKKVSACKTLKMPCLTRLYPTHLILLL